MNHTKICAACGTEKSVAAFLRIRHDALSDTCRRCTSPKKKRVRTHSAEKVVKEVIRLLEVRARRLEEAKPRLPDSTLAELERALGDFRAVAKKKRPRLPKPRTESNEQ